ncbi:MAG: efflux RND transporter periplasmic adaptor subunit [Anaerolineae bacterium]|nr:efflux RND transporter periplasmic adaptor subunit [Anaerolineae bacterium]
MSETISAPPGGHDRRRLVPVVVLVIALALAFFYWRGRQVGAADGVMTASGTIEADEVNIGVETAGRVVALPLSEGDEVHAGDVLLRLDDTVAQAQLVQARAALDAARANQALVEVGARTEDLRAAEAARDQAAAARAAAAQALANAKTLRETPQDLTARINQAETGVAAAQARLDQVKAGPRAGDLAAARAGRDQARSTLAQLETTTKTQVDMAQQALTAAENRLALVRQGPRAEDIHAAELAVEQAKNTLWGLQANRDGVCGQKKRLGESACDLAQANVAAAETAVSNAENTLAKLHNGALPEEVQVAEAAAAQARADLAAKQTTAAPALAAARAAVQSAEARVKDAETGATPEERAQAEAGLDQAQRALADLKGMRDNPLTANAQVDVAQGQLDTARAAEAAAQARLDALKNGATPEQLAVARAQVAQANAGLAVLNAQVAKLNVAAPIDGVLSRRSVHLGEAVAPGAPLMTIAPLRNLKLTVYVPEDRIGLVRLQTPVDITVDSYPGETFQGTVTFISPQAEFTPRNVQTQSERAKTVFAVKVQIPNPDQRLKAGMFADARLSAGR